MEFWRNLLGLGNAKENSDSLSSRSQVVPTFTDQKQKYDYLIKKLQEFCIEWARISRIDGLAGPHEAKIKTDLLREFGKKFMKFVDTEFIPMFGHDTNEHIVNAKYQLLKWNERISSSINTQGLFGLRSAFNEKGDAKGADNQLDILVLELVQNL